MPTAVQHSFGGGEIAPVLYSRVDTQKYASGCKTLRNNLVTRSGALMNRPGTLFAGEVKDSTKTVRLIPFQFSNTQSYVIEMGDQYARFYSNANQVTELPTSISGITNANPGVITDTAHGYANGDEVFITDIKGAIGTYLNNRNFKVAYIGANSYSLLYMDGAAVDTTSFGSYGSVGAASRVYTITTPYTYVDLPQLKYVQSGDILTMVHPNYAPQQLSRTNTILNGINTWTMSAMSFNPITVGPSNGATVGQNETLQGGGANQWALLWPGVSGITNGPTSGQIKLTWQGTQSAAINWNATQAQIQTALNTVVQAVAGGSASVSVNGTFNSSSNIYIAFTGSLASSPQPPFTTSFNTMQYLVYLMDPSFHSIQTGMAATGASGPYTFKYKVTGVDKVTGEESLPGTNGSLSVTAVTTRGTIGTLCQITTGSVHGLSSGDEIFLTLMTAAGVPQIDNTRYTVTVLDTYNFILNGVDSTTFGIYTSGGIMSYTNITATGKATPTASNPITVSPGACGANIGIVNVYKQVNGVYGFVGSVKPGSVFLDINALPDTTQQPPQYQTLFSTVNNYPSCVAYYQQRLCFANTINSPMGFWASAVGFYNNFTLSSAGLPVQDNNAISFVLASEKIDPIQNMIDVGNLILHTQNREVAVLGNNTGGQYGTLTPTAINATTQSNYGSAYIRPVLVQGSAIYVQARQSIIRDMKFDLVEDKYKGNDLTTFATHLFDAYSITDMDYQQIPNSIIWCVRSDGTLLSLTYNKEQQIFAWSHHDSSGVFRNVCVIPENGSDYVYVVAARSVETETGASRTALYIERLDNRIVEVPDVTKPIFVDSAGIYNGSNVPAIGTQYRGAESVLNLVKGYSSSSYSSTTLDAGSPSKITVRGWIKLNGDNFNNGLATRSSLSSSQGDWAFGFFTGGSNQLVMRINGLAAQAVTGTITKGVWHFVEASYDSNAGVINIFVDGVLAGTAAYSTVISNHENPITFGNYFDKTMNYAFNGQMSEWEFCANYIRNTTTYTPPTTIAVDANTTVCYHMNDGQGATLADSSGNTITGTLYGTYNLGQSTMTITTAGAWTVNDQLTLTASSAYFTSAMIGDDIRTALSDGTSLILKIIAYTSSTVVTVLSNVSVPAAYQSTAFSTWARGTKNISGLWYLENHAVSVLGDGYVMASPNNAALPLLVVHSGQITLPSNSSYAIIGCPYTSDFKSLDLDVVGYSVFMGKTAIDKWKNISEVTLQIVNTRGGFAGNTDPGTQSANANNDPLFKLYEIKPRQTLTSNPNLPPELFTDNIRQGIEGGWDIHGNAFIRQVDPLPFCLAQIAFAGELPLREQEQTIPQGAR